MIEYLRRIASHRLAWGLLAASAFALELCALFFQHVLGLHPCVMCIYERIALLGVSRPACSWSRQSAGTRWSAMLLWGYSAFWGLKLALKHVDYQMNPPLQRVRRLC
jgi:disulfide bond formation protein DsbB